MPKLYLIRGLPGSGKSTLAKKYLSEGLVSAHYEADQFFMDHGVYKFDVNKLHAAHKCCLTKTKFALSDGHSVAVSNTFTTRKELKDYLELVTEQDLVIIDCLEQYGSIHNVPEETMNRMRSRWVNKEDLE